MERRFRINLTKNKRGNFIVTKYRSPKTFITFKSKPAFIEWFGDNIDLSKKIRGGKIVKKQYAQWSVYYQSPREVINFVIRYYYMPDEA